MRQLLALLALLLGAGPLFASPPPAAWQDLGAAPQRLDLVDGLWALREPIGAVSDPVAVLDRPDWQPATIRNRNASWQRSVVWLYGRITNAGERPMTRWISVRPWRVGEVNLYLFAADRPELRHTLHSGRLLLARSEGREHVDAVFPVTLAPGESARVLILLRDLTVPTAEVRAWSPPAYTRQVTLELLADGVVLAAAATLLLLMLSSRDRGFALLGGWLASAVAFESLYNGKLLVYLLPHLADPIVPVFTQLGAAHYTFFVASSWHLLGLRWRDGWTRSLVGVVLLANLLALLTWFFPSWIEIRRLVALLGLATVLLWPVVVWRTPLPPRPGAQALRRVMTLCCATLGLYVVVAHGGPLPQSFQWLKGWFRLDHVTMLAVLWVYHLQRRSQQAAQRQHIEHLAYHDPLTGLPNRERGRVLLQEMIAGATGGAGGSHGTGGPASRPVAVLCLGLERFRLVNDGFGHARGDALLHQVVQRLAALRCGPEGSAAPVVCRVGAAEFVLLLPGVADVATAQACAGTVIERLTPPFDLEGRQIQLGSAIGLALAPQQGQDPEALMRCAGIAFHEARRQGAGPRVRLYLPEMGELSQEQLRTREALRLAIDRGEFELHYQPQRDLRSGRITVVEALLRWRRGTGELAMPAEFIAVAEDSGLIVPIGAWVLREACRQALQWPDVGVAVNVSALQFLSGELEQQVRQALADSGLPAGRLELELTESVLLDRVHDVAPTLERLRELGVLLSIDDFGTGYSSLAYLHRLSVDRLKIDRAFVLPLASAREADRALVGAIVTMARQLGLRTVAEGVESAAVGALLAELGCDAVQGYAIARPMPAEHMTRWLEDPAREPVRQADLV